MMTSNKVAIIGCGNVGKNAVNALLAAPDMQVAGIVERDEVCGKIASELSFPVVDSIAKLDKPDGALLCLPSSIVPEAAPAILRQGIVTADCFDIHGQSLLELLQTLDVAAREGNVASVSAAGWDPGTDSMLRALFQVIAPQGITHTNFGPGMSMGHTVAVKEIDGVRDALSMTIPRGRGIHDRHVYVELEQDADFALVQEQICANPYFATDKTTITQVDKVEDLLDMGHGVHIQRHGVASGVHNQTLEYSCRITNPSVTAQIMVAALRGALRQSPGAYVLLDMPLMHMLPGERERLVKQLC